MRERVTRTAWRWISGALLCTIAAALTWLSIRLLEAPAEPPVLPAPTASPEVREAAPRPRPPERVRAAEDPPADAKSSPGRTGSAVRGRLVFEGGRPPAMRRVSLARTDDGRPAEPTRLLVARPERWLDRDDDFELTGVRAGHYLLGVTFRDGTVGATKEIDVPGDEIHELRVPSLPVREDVLVRVVEPDGRTCADAEVQAGFMDSHGEHRNFGLTFYPDADGVTRVRHDAPDVPSAGFDGAKRATVPDDGAPVRLVRFLVARSPRFVPQRVEYDPQRDAELLVRFPEPVRLAVTVEGLLDSPEVDNLHVVLAPAAGGDPVAQEYAGDARFVFDPAAPGDYELRLELTRRDQPRCVVSRERIALAAGRREWTLALPRLARLTVTFPKDTSLRAGDVDVERIDGSAREPLEILAPARGQPLVVHGLAPGRYAVSVRSGPAAGEMTIDLDGDLETPWREVSWNALRVRLTGSRDARAAEEAGFCTGDVVAAVDGVDCASYLDACRALSDAAERLRVRVAVLREERRVDLDVMGALLAPTEGRTWLVPAVR